jgi:type VI protein secretion system component Hcp
MATVMNIDGVEGDSELDGYKKWIEITHVSLQFSVPHDPSGTGFKGGTVDMSEIHSAWKSRGHIPTLINKQAKGHYFPKVEIHQLITDDGNKPIRKIICEDVTFVGLDLSVVDQEGFGGGAFTMAFSKITDETLTVPTKGATPVSKGSIIYDGKAKKVMS